METVSGLVGPFLVSDRRTGEVLLRHPLIMRGVLGEYQLAVQAPECWHVRTQEEVIPFQPFPADVAHPLLIGPGEIGHPPRMNPGSISLPHSGQIIPTSREMII